MSATILTNRGYHMVSIPGLRLQVWEKSQSGQLIDAVMLDTKNDRVYDLPEETDLLEGDAERLRQASETMENRDRHNMLVAKLQGNGTLSSQEATEARRELPHWIRGRRRTGGV